MASWERLDPAENVTIFGTYTMRHRADQPLGLLWDGKSGAWRSVVGGRPWRADRERYGIAGWLAVTEVTDGDHGWHVHLHVLFFAKRSQLDVQGLQARTFGRWSAGLVRRGLAAPLLVGQDMHVVTDGGEASLGVYFAKQTHDAHAAKSRDVALEVTQTQSKSGRGEHATRSVWSLLDGVAAGDADDLDRWHEWERGSHGRRQMTWSRGLRELLALGEEVSDEDVAAEEIGTEDDTVLVIEPEGWTAIVREPARIPALLDATEDGRDALVLLLLAWEVPWRDHRPREAPA